MDNSYSTTNEHKKGQHLTYDDRLLIQIRRKDGKGIRAIAREIGCAPSTVTNEIHRGTVLMYHGRVERYKATAGQQAYEEHRTASCRHYACLKKKRFLHYVTRHFFEDRWSLDACFGRALKDGGFTREQVVGTRTLYSYVDLGLLKIKNHNLPEKLSRNTKIHHNRVNKKKLGRSIEERPAEISERKEFGHWECDLVLGAKSGGDEALFTLVERKSREYLMITIPDKSAASVMAAMEQLKKEYSEHFSDVFKTITTDNGSEFADLSDIEKAASTLVYYAHPYTSCDKGSVERHNGIIRRFIPKGKRIDSFTAEQISDVETWCNNLPRKILGYRTPDEVFEEELDKIYQVRAA
jgi:IS30 family transposase